MKTMMLVLAVAVGLALPVAAADAADASSGQKSSAGTYTGCLAKGDGPNEFKLTNVNGGNEEYELIGGKDLKDHIGHKVEVKGKEVSAKQAAKAEKASGAAEKGESEAAHEHIRVSSMRHIAETCP
jgi:ABC-type glycerol-3-phosphate transport system substrate-binding protein